MRAGLDGTSEAFTTNSVVVDIDSIVGRAATRRCNVRDDAREADTARIDAVLMEVPVAEQLCGNLRNTIDGARPLHSVLRCHVVRRIHTERADRAGREHRALVLASNLEDVPQAVDTDLPCQTRLRLCHYRQQRRKVVDGIDVVLLYCFRNAFCLYHVGKGRRTALQ